MNRHQDLTSLLAPYRVLDLTDERGQFCGKLFSDAGADVIKIEKPGGDPSRRLGPFYGDGEEPEKSLHWLAYNTGKRSITLNLGVEEGRRLFERLVKEAHFVLESFVPGYMDDLGLSYAALREINPGIIMISVTPFGQTGPYRDYAGSDITLMAMGGIMSLTGDRDRPPVKLCGQQAYDLACGDAAAAGMIAHYYRQATGRGQHVDVSIYESVVRLNHREPVNWEFEGRLTPRMGNRHARGELSNRIIWGCRDGYVNWLLYGGAAGAKENVALVQWMDEEGMATDLKDIDWAALDLWQRSQAEIEAWEKRIGEFFLMHTKKELEYEGSARGIRIVPVCDIEDVLESEQLAARGYWTVLDHAEWEDSIRYPGQLLLSSCTRARASRRAPFIGEHNLQIYGDEYGVSKEELVLLTQRGVI